MRISVIEAAKLMNCSPQMIRIGLQRGVFDFGVAIKGSSCYTYHISRNKLYEYLGIKQEA